MPQLTYEKEITGLVVIDPYNDFISEGGKVWDRVKGVAEANHCVPHMLQVLEAARKADIRVFYAPVSNLTRAMSWPPSIGVPAVSPTRIWICSSRNTAFTNSSSWD
jgi:nicotinamidase-related amidase